MKGKEIKIGKITFTFAPSIDTAVEVEVQNDQDTTSYDYVTTVEEMNAVIKMFTDARDNMS